jgi:hypothetical protein
MADGGSFYSAPSARGRRRDRLAAVAVVLVVVGIAVAIAKPWGETGAPAASRPPAVAAVSPSAAASPSSALSGSSALPSYLAHPLPVAFTTAPLPGSEAWTGLKWQKLAPGDPFAVVRSEVTWGAASVAVGDIQGTTSTTVWASTDRTHWQPVDSGASATLWSGLTVIGLATLSGKFVAVTEMNDYLYRFLPPVMSWTSTDGRSWTHANTLPVDALSSSTGSPPLVTAGPQGLLIATSGLAARYATSSDGSDWVLSTRNAFPADFALDDLESTPTGYVAIGAWMSAGSARAAALTSADGRHWPKTPTLLPTPTSGSARPAASNALTLMVGDRGMIAVGIGGSPGAALWWSSLDGRHWQPLQTFPPLGAATCGGASCGLQPNGTLIGDGHRLVAVRGGTNAVALVSTDGVHWTALDLSGDIPSAHATQAILLPGGVLVSDGTTTWFGQAVSR